MLRSQGFRRLYGVRLLSQAADGVFQASLASAVFFSPERQTDAAAVAAGFSVLLLPYSLIGPFAGVLLDRWSRARVLVRANLVRAALVLATAAVLAGPGADGLPFYLLALAVISVNRFFLATLSAGLPRVVEPGQLVTANALSVTSGTLATLVGAGIGVGLRGSGTDRDAALVALVAGAGYVVSSLVARGFAAGRLGPGATLEPAPETAPAEPLHSLGVELRDVATGFAAGARHVWTRRPAATALAAMTAHRFCFGITTLITLLAYRNLFVDEGLLRAGLPGLTQVVAASGFGTLLGAVVTPAVVRRISKPMWVTVLLGSGAVIEVGLGLPYETLTFVLAGFALGIVSQGSKICIDTIVQESVADDFRGRVFSVYDTLFNVSFVLAAAAGALVLPDDGHSPAVLVALGVLYAVTAGLYALANRRLLRIRPEVTPTGT
ncbi:MAG TPA: MFS transporter [Frankiaceae bacterium]|nr:MFS transporter [Frankiaceae bacterium]